MDIFNDTSFAAIVVWSNPHKNQFCVCALNGTTYVGQELNLDFIPQEGELCEFEIEFPSGRGYTITALRPLSYALNAEDEDALRRGYDAVKEASNRRSERRFNSPDFTMDKVLSNVKPLKDRDRWAN